MHPDTTIGSTVRIAGAEALARHFGRALAASHALDGSGSTAAHDLLVGANSNRAGIPVWVVKLRNSTSEGVQLPSKLTNAELERRFLSGQDELGCSIAVVPPAVDNRSVVANGSDHSVNRFGYVFLGAKEDREFVREAGALWRLELGLPSPSPSPSSSSSPAPSPTSTLYLSGKPTAEFPSSS